MTAAQGFDRTITSIIATYNRARYIGEAIDSILGQVEPPHQLIVVDDGSEDDTAAVVARFGSRVEYLRKDNGGKSSAINLGLQHARHHWVWLFDDDDIALPGRDSRPCLTRWPRIPRAEFAFSGQIVAEDDGSGQARDPANHRSAHRTHGGTARSNCCRPIASRCSRCWSVARRSCASARMDERFLRGQDYELMIRLARHLKGAQVSRADLHLAAAPGRTRAASKLRHGEGDRGKLWSQFEMLLGRDIRAHLALGEYLVPPRREEPSGATFSGADPSRCRHGHQGAHRRVCRRPARGRGD